MILPHLDRRLRRCLLRDVIHATLDVLIVLSVTAHVIIHWVVLDKDLWDLDPRAGLWALPTVFFYWLRKRPWFPDDSPSPTHLDAPFAEQPTLWMPTNHSRSEIDIVPVADQLERGKTAAILADHYKRLSRRHYWIERVAEDSASDNYRVSPLGGSPFLLRLHRRVTSELSLSAIHGVHRWIYDAHIFPDPHNACLLPLLTDQGEEYAWAGNQLVAAFPFAPTKRHYGGRTLAELLSVAERYGAVQRRLVQGESHLDVEAIPIVRSSITRPVSSPQSFGQLVEVAREKTRSKDGDALLSAFVDRASQLEELRGRLERLTGNTPARVTPLLHDFHPHNTFCTVNECVLIYDYEAVATSWPEQATLAFALHRFCREFVRGEKNRGLAKFEEEIPLLSQRFLAAYERGRAAVPDAVLDQLPSWIAWANFPKLVSVMSSYLGLKEDSAKRPKRVLRSEIFKFLVYLSESERFSRALRPQLCNREDR